MVKRKSARPGRGAAKPAANCIRFWREFRGLKTQGELGRKSGVTRATISRLESGALPYRQSVLEKIAKALDCKPHDLIGVNPFEMADILQIYARIPAELRERAKRTLTSFTD
jgi:transcriptional regulator with XRE-family HTH domain